jgi:hypothetical protein
MEIHATGEMLHDLHRNWNGSAECGSSPLSPISLSINDSNQITEPMWRLLIR